jgi:hypothetical protein
MGETVGCACGWSGSAEDAWTHRDQRHESRDGFPYFWLGAEAESIPTPWRTVWLGEVGCDVVAERSGVACVQAADGRGSGGDSDGSVLGARLVVGDGASVDHGGDSGERDEKSAEGVGHWVGGMRMWAPSADEILSGHSERIRRRCWVIRTADGYSAIIEPGDRWSVQTASPEGGGCGMAAETKIGGWLLARRLIRAHRRTGSW